MVVVRKLMPPSKKATNSKATANNQNVAPQGARWYSALAESGGYAVHAPPKAPPGTKNAASSTTVLRKKIWYDSRFSRGKTMSSQPIISGIRMFPNAAIKIGMATQKIIMVPWLVTRAL